MTQLFRPRSTAVFRVVLLIALIGPVVAILFLVAWTWSDYETEREVVLSQPVQFSHKHHVGGEGFDCRYCHVSVDRLAFAGMPSTKTCMTCHSQIWSDATLLEPVRKSFAEGTPLEWERVYRLPQYVYFNHGIHVNKGVACASCHGDVSKMPLIRKIRTFYMRDCLSCHREPEKHLRPLERIFDPHVSLEENPSDIGKKLLEQYHIPKTRLTDCGTCHR